MFLLCSTSSQSQCSIEDVDQSQVEPVKSWPSLCSCVFVIFRNTIISCIDTRYCKNKLIRNQNVLFITKPSSCLILRCFYTSDWTEDWVPISVCGGTKRLQNIQGRRNSARDNTHIYHLHTTSFKCFVTK